MGHARKTPRLKRETGPSILLHPLVRPRHDRDAVTHSLSRSFGLLGSDDTVMHDATSAAIERCDEGWRLTVVVRRHEDGPSIATLTYRPDGTGLLIAQTPSGIISAELHSVNRDRQRRWVAAIPTQLRGDFDPSIMTRRTAAYLTYAFIPSLILRMQHVRAATDPVVAEPGTLEWVAVPYGEGYDLQQIRTRPWCPNPMPGPAPAELADPVSLDQLVRIDRTPGRQTAYVFDMAGHEVVVQWMRRFVGGNPPASTQVYAPESGSQSSLHHAATDRELVMAYAVAVDGARVLAPAFGAAVCEQATAWRSHITQLLATGGYRQPVSLAERLAYTSDLAARELAAGRQQTPAWVYREAGPSLQRPVHPTRDPDTGSPTMPD